MFTKRKRIRVDGALVLYTTPVLKKMIIAIIIFSIIIITSSVFIHSFNYLFVLVVFYLLFSVRLSKLVCSTRIQQVVKEEHSCMHYLKVIPLRMRYDLNWHH